MGSLHNLIYFLKIEMFGFFKNTKAITNTCIQIRRIFKKTSPGPEGSILTDTVASLPFKLYG